MYAYKRQGKNFQPGTKFFHYELLRKKWQIEQEEEGGGNGVGAEGELQNVPKLNCRYNTVQGCSEGFIRRPQAKLLPAYWGRRKIQFKGNNTDKNSNYRKN